MGYSSCIESVTPHSPWARREPFAIDWASSVNALMVVGGGMPVVGGGMPVHEEGLRWARRAATRVLQTGAANTSCTLLVACVTEFLCMLPSLPRTTAFLEVLAGFGDTAKNVAEAGYTAHTFEMMNSCHENGCTAVGVLYLMYLVASVVQTGLVHFSPPCSTFLWIARWHTGRRRLNVFGADDRADVQCGNFLGEVTSPEGFNSI